MLGSVPRAITPPASPVVELALIKQHLRVDHDLDDDLIAAYVEAATQWAETYLDRALINRTLGMFFTPPTMLPDGVSSWGAWPSYIGDQRWSTYTSLDRLELPRGRVQSVAAVSIFRGDTEVALDAADYTVNTRVDPAVLVVHRQRPGDVISVVYTAGYAPSPADVPAPIRHAIMIYVAHLYEHRGDANEEPPQAIRDLLNQYRIVTF